MPTCCLVGKRGLRDGSSVNRCPNNGWGGSKLEILGVVNGKEFKDGMMPKKEDKT